MKIISHDVSMTSQHTYSRSSLQTQISFTTFLRPLPQEELQIDTPKEMDKPMFSQEYNINAMIANLINMIKDRSKPPTPMKKEEEAFASRISIRERFEESESLDFSTIGKIQTDSGWVDINMNFSMSRSFVVENNIDVHTAFDPLIINLEGGIPDLSSDTFSFDLDNDGEEDQISKLKSGNGFLAYDRNEDGKINQGSELFGTKTGDGFGELAEYDEDNNGWIDESDSIFNKLRVWFQNEETQEKELVGLGETGIGAIYLNATAGEFTYKTEENQTLGELKSCSFFLNEDGTCGNVSQIDLCAKEEPLANLLQA